MTTDTTTTVQLTDAQLAQFTACGRSLKNQMAEAFIRGLQVGADEPDLAGDGDAMYQAFRDWWSQP